MTTHLPIEPETPVSVANLNLEPRGRVFPSPSLWKNHIFYQILPDRFSDGREAERPLFDYNQPEQYRISDKRAWMEAGLGFTGGTLKGIRSKLDYLQGMGINGLWLNPSFKQRTDLNTYHGYAIQNFLDIDPRFGTTQDLRDLIDDAHDRGMVVVLDVVIDHTGNNWFYGPDVTGIIEDSLPYRYDPPYSFGGWRSSTGQPTPEIHTLEDGCWPQELQSLEAYNRRGSIVNWSNPDPMDPNAEFRRGDFFDLKKLNGYHNETLDAIIRCYQYWIAVTDCDGFRIDAAKHIPKDICQQFSFNIFRYAQSIGKDNFMLVGEITDNLMSFNYLSLFGSIFDRALTAVLDINNSPNLLAGAARGTANPMDFFGRYSTDNELSRYIQTGRVHVAIFDDHDMSCRSHKQRFAAHNDTPHRYWQSAHVVGIQLTTPGIPCIYYGTEQAFEGSEDSHDYSIESQRFGEDRYIREDMFGGSFGAFETQGCHFFNPEHPTYLRIAAIARLRNGDNAIGRTLRMGVCYPRETSFCGYPFQMPGAGELFGWSRVLAYHEVVMVLNTNGVESRGADITVDKSLHPPGSTLQVLYRADWTDEQLKHSPTDEAVEVEKATTDGRAYIRLNLPPAGMVILG
ncbi:MAG: alpha-amlyase [Pseudanabaena sp.]|nr:MAG: alpha-amlyase [Pseudanabaena sp.]